MARPKQHESTEKIEQHLESCLKWSRCCCLDPSEQVQAGGLRLLRELYRARRNGRMTPEQRKRYEGVLKYVRPLVRDMARRGMHIPPVVEAELRRVHEDARRLRLASRGDRPRHPPEPMDTNESPELE